MLDKIERPEGYRLFITQFHISQLTVYITTTIITITWMLVQCIVYFMHRKSFFSHCTIGVISSEVLC